MLLNTSKHISAGLIGEWDCPTIWEDAENFINLFRWLFIAFIPTAVRIKLWPLLFGT
jgi:hypothetical protein